MQQNDYDDFDKWVDQWDAAVKNGVFKSNTPTTPSPRTGESSFFGLTTSSPSDAPSDPDTRYWTDVYERSKLFGLNGATDELIQETKVDSKGYTAAMAYSPNPIRPNSVGKDQDVSNPISTGSTYDVADLQGLETLKLKLHGLLNKLNGFDGLGKSDAKLESQIESLKKQIDEISDNLSHGVPSQQGD